MKPAAQKKYNNLTGYSAAVREAFPVSNNPNTTFTRKPVPDIKDMPQQEAAAYLINQ